MNLRRAGASTIGLLHPIGCGQSSAQNPGEAPHPYGTFEEQIRYIANGQFKDQLPMYCTVLYAADTVLYDMKGFTVQAVNPTSEMMIMGVERRGWCEGHGMGGLLGVVDGGV